MFNAARFARMKRGAFIVNTARGGIIDELALHAALSSGHLAGAGLDVFDMEPTPVNNTLLQLDKVITSPHMAGVTTESVAGMAVVTAEEHPERSGWQAEPGQCDQRRGARLTHTMSLRGAERRSNLHREWRAPSPLRMGIAASLRSSQ
jgi:phosphoglycerate dehydrogenase-like enzyme